MIQVGTKSQVKPGTEYDVTGDQSKVMEIGKVYSGTFNVSGLLTGDEARVVSDISNQITYPAGHPEYYGRCSPTYIMVDSASATAYAEWIVNDTDEYGNPYNPAVIPVMLVYVILVCITAILIAWLITVSITKATEFVEATGDNFKYVAIAGVIGAVAVATAVGVWAYQNYKSKGKTTVKGALGL